MGRRWEDGVTGVREKLLMINIFGWLVIFQLGESTSLVPRPPPEKCGEGLEGFAREACRDRNKRHPFKTTMY